MTVNVTYSEAIPAAHRAARYVADLAKVDLDADPTTFPTIAVLASSGESHEICSLDGNLKQLRR